MEISFAEIAEGLRHYVTWETHRIEFMREAALRGRVRPPPDEAFGAWVARLERLRAALVFFEVMAPRETEVCALDSRLKASAASAKQISPTMWIG